MEYYAEWRLRGDRYDNGYGNGLTLGNGESVQEMQKLEENDSVTVFRGKRGHLLRCFHEKTGDVTVCRTEFTNETEEPVVIEMLASFSLRGVTADRIDDAFICPEITGSDHCPVGLDIRI